MGSNNVIITKLIESYQKLETITSKHIINNDETNSLMHIAIICEDNCNRKNLLNLLYAKQSENDSTKYIINLESHEIILHLYQDYQIFINNVFLYDTIICILNLNFTIDELEFMNYALCGSDLNDQLYDIKTNIVILIDKCDDMVCEADGALSFINDNARNQYDNLLSLINKYNSTSSIEIYPITLESAVLYYHCKQLPTPAIINEIGSMEFGKLFWNKMSSEERIEQIQQFVESTEFQKRVDSTGLTSFSNALTNHSLNETIISSNKIKFAIKLQHQQNDYDMLILLETHAQKIKIFNEKFGTDGSLVTQLISKFSEFLDNYLGKTDIEYNLLLNNIHSKDSCTKLFNIYMLFKKISTLTFDRELFIDMIASNTKYLFNKCINKKLIDFFIDMIQKIKILTHASIIENNLYETNLEVKMQYIDKLITIEDKEWKKQLCQSILSSDFFELTPEKQIQKVNQIIDKYYLSNEEVINLWFAVLDETYSRNIQIVDKDKYYATKYIFWSDIFIKKSNHFYQYISELKILLAKIVAKPIDGLAETVIETHLVKLLQIKYPTDFFMYSEFDSNIRK